MKLNDRDRSAIMDASTGTRSEPPPIRPDHALFLDFDGTLVDIAETPSLVRVTDELPWLLIALERFLGGALALVSGRPLSDLMHHLTPFSGVLVGLHGLERHDGAGQMSPPVATSAMAPFRQAFIEFAARHDGVLLEDKRSGLALHYRKAPNHGAACRAMVRTAAAISNGTLVAIEGKMVVELVLQKAGKDKAIADLLASAPFRGRIPVFAGDDITDEDGFSVVNQANGISIHVGPGASVANHRLATAGSVRLWLLRSLEG